MPGNDPTFDPKALVAEIHLASRRQELLDVIAKINDSVIRTLNNFQQAFQALSTIQQVYLTALTDIASWQPGLTKMLITQLGQVDHCTSVGRELVNVLDALVIHVPFPPASSPPTGDQPAEPPPPPPEETPPSALPVLNGFHHRVGEA